MGVISQIGSTANSKIVCVWRGGGGGEVLLPQASLPEVSNNWEIMHLPYMATMFNH